MAEETMLTVAGSSIELGPLPFNLHIVDARGRMVLYGRKGVVITPELKESIERQNRVFYISGQEVNTFIDYALSNMQRIVKDRTVNPRIKTTIIRDVGQKIFQKIDKDGLCEATAEHSRQFTRSITDLIIGSPDAYHGLLTMATQKSYIYDHAANTCTFCILVGQKIWGSDEVTLFQFGLGGLLMNIGMTRVDQKILDKTGPLTPDERIQVEKHAMFGYEALKEQQMPQMVLDMARWHHERLDGSGYPDGLGGNQIPMHAQLAAVCDVYDSLTSIRSFRPQMNPVTAIQELLNFRDKFALRAIELLMHVVLKNDNLVQGMLSRLN